MLNTRGGNRQTDCDAPIRSSRPASTRVWHPTARRHKRLHRPRCSAAPHSDIIPFSAVKVAPTDGRAHSPSPSRPSPAVSHRFIPPRRLYPGFAMRQIPPLRRRDKQTNRHGGRKKSNQTTTSRAKDASKRCCFLGKKRRRLRTFLPRMDLLG